MTDMFITNDTKHVALPYHQGLAQVIPHARAFDYQGSRMLLVPNGKEEGRIARNLGIPFPTPILTQFDWCNLKPWDIQRWTAALLTESRRAYVLSEIGTGKTLAVIFAAEYLRQIREVRRVLVIAPLSTLTPVWESELFLARPRAAVRVLYGDKAKRLRLLADEAEWYVTNHHGLVLLQDALIARRFDLVVIDEIATFRTKSTGLWKAANALIQSNPRYVWGVTGSPRPKAPTDVWAQIQLLTPERTSKTFTRFRDLTMQQLSQFRWVERSGANDLIHSQMQPSVRYRLDDVHELPPLIVRDHPVKLEPKAEQAYKLMYNRLRIMSEKGDITAANEGVLQSKLLQVACGYIYTDDKKVYTLPNNTRLEALYDYIVAAEKKVIVFVPYVHALQGVKDYLVKKKQDVEIVYGDTAKGTRDRIFNQFQNSPLPHVLVAHPQCMAHGLTLTAANVIIWYTATNNPEIYEQANGRIRRPGQDTKTLIVHLTGTPVERVAYNRLKTRGRMQGLLLELFRQQEMDL